MLPTFDQKMAETPPAPSLSCHPHTKQRAAQASRQSPRVAVYSKPLRTIFWLWPCSLPTYAPRQACGARIRPRWSVVHVTPARFARATSAILLRYLLQRCGSALDLLAGVFQYFAHTQDLFIS